MDRRSEADIRFMVAQGRERRWNGERKGGRKVRGGGRPTRRVG